MSAIISRMVWFLVVAVALSYAVYLVAGSIVHAQASRENQAVVIRDELGAGVHHLSGMIMVPTSCDELSVHTEAISGLPAPARAARAGGQADNTYTLRFRTWHEPSIDCISGLTPRYFRIILFAPSADIQFTATLDGTGLPIIVMPTLPGRALLEL